MFLVASRCALEKILSTSMRSCRVIELSAALYRTLARVDIVATITLLAAETDACMIALQCCDAVSLICVRVDLPLLCTSYIPPRYLVRSVVLTTTL